MNMIDTIIENEEYFEEQFLEKPRKNLWSDIMQYPLESTSAEQLTHILSEIESAHNDHGKPLRLVRIKRTVTTEIEIIKEFKKTKRG
ncbi:hypothetical protein ACTFQF_00640 [Aliivibrio fischeri]|uniref:hypothetical protein n=1 Tax=Aliivibrio fischeri TaxID=668 RepID=UPI0007C4C866|nr:hypothetical protein [Aliivibrio fischeri]MUK37562.1 hypothetical protein [Aliivibrio fischeri]